MKSTLISTAGAILMLIGVSAHSQGMGMGAPDFDTIDTDGDGELSSEEVATLPPVQNGNVSADQLITNWDTDGNGTVSEQEFEDRPAMGMGMGG